MNCSPDQIKHFSPEETTLLATELGHCLAQYYRECQAKTGRTVPPLTPDHYVQMATAAMECQPTQGETSTPARFFELATMALSNGHHLHDPRYMGHQVPPVVPASALFDVLGRAANQGAAVFEMAPFGTAAERAVINALGQLIGWQAGTFAGIGTHGGTLANVTALLAARNIRYPDSWQSGMAAPGAAGAAGASGGKSPLKPAIMASADSHYCIARACGILGIGTAQLIKIPVDENRRMDLAKARELLQTSQTNGLDVFAIVGSACTTPTGSFDDLAGIAKIAAENKLWFHVDGSHGASFLFSEKHRHLVSGIEHADSIAWDAHKMLFVPALCTYLFYKNARHSWEAFSQDAPYLFNPIRREDSADHQDVAGGLAEYDGGLRTFECTKGALSLGLWGIWSLYGKDFIASLIDRAMANTSAMFDLIQNAPDFEAAHDPQCNILCFRHVPVGHELETDALSDLQMNIRNRLLNEGNWYITGTRLNNAYWLRVTLINPLTTTEHLMGLLDAIRMIAAANHST